ncbi:hypothetical protein [Rufibacter hautae]|uniref:Uncharacterized protein n=1 Tax=Rufibacter hautae TaxID=2595005 RepID=A0A5B6TH48_9BACT|nr:hypothetical protein [Rufibacter hautae]KAA3439573.1 hypothetical protein FOA19_02490 [Rufibacter hautae]
MAIFKDGDTYVIREQPQLTNNTMGALIQFLDLVPDMASLHLLVNNLAFHAVTRDPEHVNDWGADYAAMNALQLFLTALTRQQESED